MSAKGGTARQNRRRGELVFLVALGLVLSACSSTGPELSEHRGLGYHRGQPSYKIGAPYQINGKWYTPRVDYGYDDTGFASWYGEGFDGQATANGEIFNLNELSAAHKTLPLPSVVEVTNLRNSRALRLRVNDRGPYVDGRIIDVSRRAAQLLGFEMAGTTPVRVRILREESIQVAEAAKRGQSGSVRLAAAAGSGAPPPPRPAPPPVIALPPPPRPIAAASPEVASPPRQAPSVEVAEAAPLPALPQHHWPELIGSAQAETMRPSAILSGSSPRIFVQAGAFAVAENAQRVRARIASFGIVQVVTAEVNGNALYRVRLGPVASEAEADRLLRQVVGSGYPAARIVSE